jgi:hypothetical protein
MMTIHQLARYKMDTRQPANPARRNAVVFALQWTGRMRHMVLPKWDATAGRAKETRDELRGYMAALAAAKDAGSVLTDAQRAEVEATAKQAAQVAQAIADGWPEIWGK